MKFLIDNGANVNSEIKTGTALMKASTYKLENVKLLVNAGADPHYIIRYESAGVVHSPLNTAIMNNHIDMVNYYLFECGIDPHSITVTNKKTGTWTIIDRVKSMQFAKTDTISYKKKEKLMQYLREQGFKLRGEEQVVTQVFG